MITFGSGCSGIESASMAWHPLGWRAAWFAEIEPFPKKVLAHRWPNVTDHGDFMTLRPKIERGEIIAPDVFVAGTQDPDVNSELAHTMGRNWEQENAIIKGYAVRRLTPRECERLQGFPDDYTNVPGASDGARYKALGNSKAVPVVRWIGQRIAKQIGGGDKVEEIEAKVNTILNSLGLGLLFDVAQTLAWGHARDFPNDDDYRVASEMIERWQTARKLTGAKPL